MDQGGGGEGRGESGDPLLTRLSFILLRVCWQAELLGLDTFSLPTTQLSALNASV
jgi:hypothetical protein